MKYLIFLLLIPFLSLGQTKIDIPTQTKNANFSSFPSTIPATVSSSLPGSCTIGQFDFLNTATAGQNIYLCTSTNTWTQVVGTGGSGGSVATSISALTDFNVIISGATLTVGSNCSTSTPCIFRYNSYARQVTAPAIAVINNSATGVAYIYLNSSGQLVVSSTSIGYSCSNCITNTGGVFPYGTIPLFTWSSSLGNTWDTNGGVDFRALYYANGFAGSNGIVCTDSTGLQTCSIDGSVIQQKVAVPSTSTSTCVAGTFAVSSTYRYECVATNTWVRTALSTF